MQRSWKYTALVVSLLLASPAAAQRQVELGLDAGAVFGLGSQSSVNVTLPGTRFRVGFFRPGTRISVEPAAGFTYNKVEGTDGVFTYNLELGGLYHFRPLMGVRINEDTLTRRVMQPYVRPFIGFTGFTGGDTDDNEFSLGGGIGTKIPFRSDVSIRLEANLGYGFDNKAARIGALAGLSFFPR